MINSSTANRPTLYLFVIAAVTLLYMTEPILIPPRRGCGCSKKRKESSDANS